MDTYRAIAQHLSTLTVEEVAALLAQHTGWTFSEPKPLSMEMPEWTDAYLDGWFKLLHYVPAR